VGSFECRTDEGVDEGERRLRLVEGTTGGIVKKEEVGMATDIKRSSGMSILEPARIILRC
jgi:hypothetical protein